MSHRQTNELSPSAKHILQTLIGCLFITLCLGCDERRSDKTSNPATSAQPAKPNTSASSSDEKQRPGFLTIDERLAYEKRVTSDELESVHTTRSPYKRDVVLMGWAILSDPKEVSDADWNRFLNMSSELFAPKPNSEGYTSNDEASDVNSFVISTLVKLRCARPDRQDFRDELIRLISTVRSDPGSALTLHIGCTFLLREQNGTLETPLWVSKLRDELAKNSVNVTLTEKHMPALCPSVATVPQK